MYAASLHGDPLFHPALRPCRQHQIPSVHQDVHDGSQPEGGGHIEDGMLLDEHSGQYNGEGQDAGGYPDALLLPQRAAAHDGEMSAHGIVHMDAGPQVRGRVYLPQYGDSLREHIVPGHLVKPQVMAVGPQRGDDQEDRHPCEQKSAAAVIFLFILKEEEDHYQRHIGEPQKVRDDERLTEGDVIVHAHMDDRVVSSVAALQPREPCQIDDHVDCQGNCMPVFHVQALYFFHFYKTRPFFFAYIVY